MLKGKLYIVSTPIGNMDDITLRALKVLESVDLILSEDTRETDKIIQKYLKIKPQQISYREQNHQRIIDFIIESLEIGKNLALVSDSGTPLISDPGFKLVEEVKSKRFDVVSIPGPSAAIAALSVCGLPTDKFTFLGFLPKTASQRTKLLKTYGEQDATLIIYESPFRVLKLIEEIRNTLGNRKMCLVNDITKMYEKIECDYATNLLQKNSTNKLKGEFVVLVAKEKYL